MIGTESSSAELDVAVELGNLEKPLLIQMIHDLKKQITTFGEDVKKCLIYDSIT